MKSEDIDKRLSKKYLHYMNCEKSIELSTKSFEILCSGNEKLWSGLKIILNEFR